MGNVGRNRRRRSGPCPRRRGGARRCTAPEPTSGRQVRSSGRGDRRPGGRAPRGSRLGRGRHGGWGRGGRRRVGRLPSRRARTRRSRRARAGTRTLTRPTSTPTWHRFVPHRFPAPQRSLGPAARRARLSPGRPCAGTPSDRPPDDRRCSPAGTGEQHHRRRPVRHHAPTSTATPGPTERRKPAAMRTAEPSGSGACRGASHDGARRHPGSHHQIVTRQLRSRVLTGGARPAEARPTRCACSRADGRRGVVDRGCTVRGCLSRRAWTISSRASG